MHTSHSTFFKQMPIPPPTTFTYLSPLPILPYSPAWMTPSRHSGNPKNCCSPHYLAPKTRTSISSDLASTKLATTQQVPPLLTTNSLSDSWHIYFYFLIQFQAITPLNKYLCQHCQELPSNIYVLSSQFFFYPFESKLASK